jgi:hypothetical protein
MPFDDTPCRLPAGARASLPGECTASTQCACPDVEALREENESLRLKIGKLRAEVEDLRKYKEEMRLQSATSGSQYTQIMAMSSRLQAQTAADRKKWKEEKEKWYQERENLISKMKQLESQSLGSPPGSCVPDDCPGVSDEQGGADILESGSPDTLRSEIVRLRTLCERSGRALEDLKGDIAELETASGALASFIQRCKQRE